MSFIFVTTFSHAFLISRPLMSIYHRNLKVKTENKQINKNNKNENINYFCLTTDVKFKPMKHGHGHRTQTPLIIKNT